MKIFSSMDKKVAKTQKSEIEIKNIDFDKVVDQTFYTNIGKSGYHNWYKCDFNLNGENYSINVMKDGWVSPNIETQNCRDSKGKLVKISESTRNAVLNANKEYIKANKSKIKTI